MSDAITAISQAMNGDLTRLQAVSQNITNSSTNGFQSVRMIPVEPNGTSSVSTGAASGLSVRYQPVVTGGVGSMADTGRSLDLALDGPGYFQVQTADGPRLTRLGSFQLDREGRLITGRGGIVMGENGPITLPGSSVHINRAGEILEDGRVIDRLKVVMPRTTGGLRPEGNGLYSYDGTVESARDSQVHQGKLAASNVDVTGEMVRLIELSRHMESVQRAMSAYDRMLDTGINKLGSNR